MPIDHGRRRAYVRERAGGRNRLPIGESPHAETTEAEDLAAQATEALAGIAKSLHSCLGRMLDMWENAVEDDPPSDYEEIRDSVVATMGLLKAISDRQR